MCHIVEIDPEVSRSQRFCARVGYDSSPASKTSSAPTDAQGRPPLAVYHERDKATPSIDGQAVPPTTNLRRDRVDTNGTVTLRHRSKLHHVGVGRAQRHQRVLMLVADLDVRILDAEGNLLRHLTLDPSRDYQPIR